MMRCGFITIIGAPNAGKSTLLNALVGQKVSIVTHKAQTTRRRVLGIRNLEHAQLVFIDTPGIFQARKVFDRKLVESAQQGVCEADFCLVLVDVAKKKVDVSALLAALPPKSPPLILVLNKIDLINKHQLLPLVATLNQTASFQEIFMISATQADGTEALLAFLAKNAPEGPWHYPEDQISNLSDRQLAAEIVREKLFLYLHDEIPYGLTVDTEAWEQLDNGGVIISLLIYIEREGHKPIVLGHHGQMIKRIGQEARLELSNLWKIPVHLKIFVKVKEMWTTRPDLYGELGLEFGE